MTDDTVNEIHIYHDPDGEQFYNEEPAPDDEIHLSVATDQQMEIFVNLVLHGIEVIRKMPDDRTEFDPKDN